MTLSISENILGCDMVFIKEDGDSCIHVIRSKVPWINFMEFSVFILQVWS
jgi:hypothetical protein